MSNKVILITGSSGFVASKLVPLVSTAHQLVGIDIEASRREMIKDGTDRPRVKAPANVTVPVYTP